ncbi:hypothetical protein EDD22DRAFT_853238 [Suillus occidentalis]|nr:hypothetical protein EDD22DRAFT_853238 [Suillus occidentalis]
MPFTTPLGSRFPSCSSIARQQAEIQHAIHDQDLGMHYTATMQYPLQSTIYWTIAACWLVDNVEIPLVEQMSHAQPAQVNLPQKPREHQSTTRITVLPGFKSDSDRWHTSLFTTPIETLGNLIQTSTLDDLASPATFHKDRVWAVNEGFDAINGNCDHPSNSGKDGEADELNRPHGTCHNHALVAAVGTRKLLTNQSLVE